MQKIYIIILLCYPLYFFYLGMLMQLVCFVFFFSKKNNKIFNYNRIVTDIYIITFLFFLGFIDLQFIMQHLKD
jgi:hypothetical protein